MPTTDLPKADQMPLSLRAAAIGLRHSFGEQSDLAALLDEAAEHIEATWANYRQSNEQARRLGQHHDSCRGAVTEAAALLETAEQDGRVSAGWLEDARAWRNCWQDVLT